MPVLASAIEPIYRPGYCNTLGVLVWILTLWHHLGSVLWPLQRCWPQQSPPGEQRHRRDREVVAEPSSLQRTALQRGECYPGPRAGEMITLDSAMNSCLPAAALRFDWWFLCGDSRTPQLDFGEKRQGRCFLSCFSFLCCCEMSCAACVRLQSSFTEVKSEIFSPHTLRVVLCVICFGLPKRKSRCFHSQNIPKGLHDFQLELHLLS